MFWPSSEVMKMQLVIIQKAALVLKFYFQVTLGAKEVLQLSKNVIPMFLM